MPDWIAPQLASLAKSAPTGAGYATEIKFDGYRFLIRVLDGKARLYTRGRNDWTAKLPSLASELEGLAVTSAWLDGEAVWLDSAGHPSFNGLQNAFDRSREGSIVLYLFDVMYLDGVDLRKRPQSERSSILSELFASRRGTRIRLSSDLGSDAASALRSACELSLEGVIAKRLDAPYESGRSRSWLKLKCLQRQEFLVGGFTLREGVASEIGSLLLGEFDSKGVLMPAGSVGTGWDAGTSKSLRDALSLIGASSSPFGKHHSAGRWAKRVKGSELWVEPRLIVDVAYQERTPDGSVRHASFKGARISLETESDPRLHAPTLVRAP